MPHNYPVLGQDRDIKRKTTNEERTHRRWVDGQCNCSLHYDQHLMRTVLDHPSVDSFDRRIDKTLDLLRGNRWTDRVFYVASEIGNHSMIWHALNAVQLVLHKRLARSLTIALCIGIESALVNGPIKMAFRRGRPDYLGHHPHSLRTPKTSSFPSGHATSAFCAATLLSSPNSNRKNIYYMVAAIIASSRAYVRIHHASDVIAGILLGLGMGAIAKRFIEK